MSRNERGAADIKTVSLVVLLVALTIGFFMQMNFLPEVEPGKMLWWRGLVQGIFAVPNLLLIQVTGDKTLSIYQSGADGWYSLCWLIGFTAVIIIGIVSVRGRRP